MNRLNTKRQEKTIAALVGGNSLRETARTCDVASNTALKLMPEIGRACEEYQRRPLVNLPCKRIQCDEIWSFCYAKEKNVPEEPRIAIATNGLSHRGNQGFRSGLPTLATVIHYIQPRCHKC